MRYITLSALLILWSLTVAADTTITYQGQLQDQGQPYSGPAGLVFKLYDSEISTSELDEISRSVEVSDGLFQTTLDFGSQPYASGLWLEITVNGITLDERQPLHAVPLALSVPPNSIGSTEIAVDFADAEHSHAGSATAFGRVNRFDVNADYSYNVESVSWNADLERYEISIQDHSFSLNDGATVSISGDAGSCPAGSVARTSSVSGNLLVFIVNSAGENIECSFRFAVFIQ